MRKIRYAPVAILVLLTLSIDFYVFQGVKALTSQLSTSVQNGMNAFYWLISVAVIVFFLANLYRIFINGRVSGAFNFSINTFLTLFVTKLAFIIVLLAEDTFRLIAGAFYPGLAAERSAIVSQLGLALSAFPFFAFIYGVTKGKYNYKVHKVTLFYKDLPPEFDGFKIVQISDIHAGSFDNREAVERGVKLINKQNADLVVFTGDLVNNKSEEILPWIDTFSQITARHGKYSVLGNHDYGDYIQWESVQAKNKNLQDLKAYHKQMGFRLLLDEHVSIEKNNHSIKLAGVENWGLGFGQRGDLNKSLSGLNGDSFKVLLSHDPTHWQSQVKSYPTKIHLTLSGHTHGMQFGIEALGLKWSPVQYRYKHWAGLTSENGRYLYINRGFGFLGFSGRVGIWPEITVINLKSKAK